MQAASFKKYMNGRSTLSLLIYFSLNLALTLLNKVVLEKVCCWRYDPIIRIRCPQEPLLNMSQDSTPLPLYSPTCHIFLVGLCLDPPKKKKPGRGPKPETATNRPCQARPLLRSLQREHWHQQCLTVSQPATPYLSLHLLHHHPPPLPLKSLMPTV
jgi:hypothetical protein